MMPPKMQKNLKPLPGYDDATDSYPGQGNGPAGDPNITASLEEAMREANEAGIGAEQMHEMVDRCCGEKELDDDLAMLQSR